MNQICLRVNSLEYCFSIISRLPVPSDGLSGELLDEGRAVPSDSAIRRCRSGNVEFPFLKEQIFWSRRKEDMQQWRIRGRGTFWKRSGH